MLGILGPFVFAALVCPRTGAGGEDGALPDVVEAGMHALDEDDLRAAHERMLAKLAELAERSLNDDPTYGKRQLVRLRELVAEAGDGDGEPSARLLQAWAALGIQELFHGDPEESVRLLERAYEASYALPEERRPRGLTFLTYNLAVAWMRLGETRNCVALHTSQSCILPIEGSGVHTEQEGSRKAIRYLLEVLARTEEESDTHLGARWLLNVAAMTVGEYPDGVPAEHRIAPDTFASEAPFPRWRDVAPDLDVNVFATAGGVVAEDLDGDGLIDLFVTAWAPDAQAVLLHRRKDGGWADGTEEAGLEGITGGLNVTHADHDSDGDVDLLVLRGGWQLGWYGQLPNSLLRNEGPERPGTFLDVSFPAGLGETFYPSQTADWADYDLDGDLDFYVGNEASQNSPFPGQLFRNEGDGTFVDVAREAGVTNMRMAKGVTWGDVDGDRDPDLYVSNYLGANRLYVNDGGKFEDVARERGVDRPNDSFPCWFWDFDNDGALDLYVASYYQSTGEARLGPVVASYLGLPVRQDLNKLYRGDGHGGFTDVAVARGLDLFTLAMGASFGDLDNDGWLDFYLGTGYPFYDGLVPNVMYRNLGGEGFADVTTAGGFGHLQKGHGITFADLDQDGDEDVYEVMGGAYAGDAFGNALFENPGSPGRWIKVRLQGTRSNRSGVGARVRVVFREGDEERSVWRTVGQHGSFGSSMLELHVGIGAAERVERLEVFWPVTGRSTTFADLPAGKRVLVVEGADEPVVEDVTALPFAR